jgi:hypothetical protein
MKTILVLLTPLMLAIAVILYAVSKDKKKTGYTEEQLKFFEVIHQIESNNAPSGEHVKGSSGELGPLQITYDFWFDAVVFNKTLHRGTWQDVVHLDYAEEVVNGYFNRYCSNLWEDVDTNVFHLAQIYNGGPRGHGKKSTVEYAERFQAVYHAL